jgi:excisionase family DNA binding protein
MMLKEDTLFVCRRGLWLSEDTIYTVEQIAERLKVHTQTVYRLLEAGKLPGVKVGRQWRITPEALNSFLKLPFDQAKQSLDT